MRSSNGLIVLDTAKAISHTYGDVISYTDTTGLQLEVPLDLIIRLHDIAKFECERKGGNWDQESKAILERRK